MSVPYFNQAAPRSRIGLVVVAAPWPYSAFHGPSKLPFSREWLNRIGGMKGWGRQEGAGDDDRVDGGAAVPDCSLRSSSGAAAMMEILLFNDFSSVVARDGMVTGDLGFGGASSTGAGEAVEVFVLVKMRGEKTGGGSRPMRGMVLRGWMKGGVSGREGKVDAIDVFTDGGAAAF